MRTIVLSVIFSFSILANASSQNYRFKMYCFDCLEAFDIYIEKPKGFKAIGGGIPFLVNDKDNVGTYCRLVLESKSKDCLILYSPFILIREHDTMTKVMVYAEVKAGLGLNSSNNAIRIDTAKYVKTIAGDNMRSYFNADTVFITKIPLQKPYNEIYSYCTGIYMIKTGHPSAMIKVLFSEEGKKKEDEYMQALFNSIKYSDTAPEWSQEKAEKIQKKLKSKFSFYIKKYNLTSY